MTPPLNPSADGRCEFRQTFLAAICRQYKPKLDEYRGQLEQLIYGAQPDATQARIFGVKGATLLSQELGALNAVSGIPTADAAAFERWTADVTRAGNILQQVGGFFDDPRIAARDLQRAQGALADAGADQSGLGC